MQEEGLENKPMKDYHQLRNKLDHFPKEKLKGKPKKYCQKKNKADNKRAKKAIEKEKEQKDTARSMTNKLLSDIKENVQPQEEEVELITIQDEEEPEEQEVEILCRQNEQ